MGGRHVPDHPGRPPGSATEEAAYGKWLDQTSDRESARLDRLHGADGVLPWPLWAALLFTALVILTFMLFFADSGESALIQGLQIGSVVMVMATLLLLIRFLDHPFREGSGGLQPVAMERSLSILEDELQGRGQPCAAGLRRGRPAAMTAGAVTERRRSQLGRARGDDAARRDGRDHGLVRLPGDQVER